jgi:alkylhydroperoxidase family enzyme
MSKAKSAAASVKPVKVSRLPPLPDPLPPEVQQLFETRLKTMGRLLNLHQVLAHAPKLSKASAQMAYSLRNETSAPRIDIELAIVRAGMNANGKYEVQQHKPMLLAEGFSSRKYNALAKWRSSKLFDAKERAILAYTDQMSNRGNVSDRTFNELARHFDARQIMELTSAIATYYGISLLMNALDLKLEKKKK